MKLTKTSKNNLNKYISIYFYRKENEIFIVAKNYYIIRIITIN